MSFALKNRRFFLSLFEISLLTAVVFLFFQTLSFGFIWDDNNAILDNRLVQSPHGLVEILKGGTIDFWPVTYAFYWIENYFFGHEPFGYHLLNVVLFAFSVTLVYRVLKSLNLKSAFWVSLIYTVHPLNVEIVSWVTQSKTLLAHIFGLLSLLLWIKFVRERRSSYFIFCICYFVLSLLSKISLFMLPFLMLAYYWYTEPATNRKKILMWSAPLFIVSLFFGAANILWCKDSNTHQAFEIILEKDIFFRFALIGQNFLFYLLKTFWPFPLMLVHPRQMLMAADFFSYLPTIVLLILSAFFIYKIIARKHINVFITGFAAAFIILLPVLGLAEIYFMRFSFVAEHWAGLAILGFLVPMAEFILSKEKYSRIFLSVIAVILFCLSFSYAQNFSSNKKLFESNYEKNQNSTLVNSELGLIYKHEGQLDRALKLFQASLSIQESAEDNFNVASIYDEQKNFTAAEPYYLKALEMNRTTRKFL